MANTIKLKRGTSTPSTSDIASGEVAVDTSAKKLYINDSGTVKEIGGGGGGVSSDSEYNTVAGTNAGDSFSGTDAKYNTLIGYDAGTAVTDGDWNTAVGAFAFDASTTGGNNTAIGANALTINSTGDKNTAVGRNAGFMVTTGSNNTAVGYYSLGSNQTISNHTAIGYQASYSVAGTSIEPNTTVGYQAGYSGTTTERLTAVGHQAAYSMTTASWNSAFGYKALYSCTTNGQNTALGNLAGQYTTGSSNTLVGYKALSGVSGSTTGSNNTVIGEKAAEVATSMANTTIVGYRAGRDITTAENNTFVGYESGNAVTTGGYNVALGHSSAKALTTGANNTILGYNSGIAMTGANYNTIVGALTGNLITSGSNTLVGRALAGAATSVEGTVGMGVGALAALTTGDNNTAIGHQAGDAITTGANNLILGYNAAASAVGVSNEITLGDTNITKFRIPGINFELADQGGTPTNGHVLTMASGGATWQAAAGGGGVSSDSYRNTVGGTNAGDSIDGESGTIDNTFFGYDAGTDITDGTKNTFVGSYAGANTNSGTYLNTFVGFQAGMNNGNGHQNIGIGYVALQNNEAWSNVAIGNNAGEDNTTGTKNQFVGRNAGMNNTTGSYNVAIGHESLKTNTTGSDSIAIGDEALKSQISANSNIGIGSDSLKFTTTGSWNVALGDSAGEDITTGSGNTILGHKAVFSADTAANCTIIGRNAGGDLTSGSNNIVIGYEAEPSAGNATNEITLGDTNITKFRVPGLNFVVKDSTATDNYVLTVDANGEAGWEAAAGGGGGATGIDFNDDVKARFGTGNDLEIYHDGSNSRVRETGTGNLRLEGTAVELWNDGAKVCNTFANGIQVTGVSSTGGIDIGGDNLKLRIGASQDLQIYHDGTDSIISNATNVLKTHSTNTYLRNVAGDEELATFTQDGAVKLYYDNSKKFETTALGVQIPDSFSLCLGNGADIRMWFQDSGPIAGYIDCNQGHFYIRNNVNDVDGGDIYIQGRSGEDSIIAKNDGAVELYYDDSKKLETTAAGVNLTGSSINIYADSAHAYVYARPVGSGVYANFLGTNAAGSVSCGMTTWQGQNIYLDSSNNGTIHLRAAGTGDIGFMTNGAWRMTIDDANILLPDSQKINFGAGNDLQIYHDGTDSRIDATGTGNLIIKGDDVHIQGTNAENMANFNENAGVQLRYDGTTKFETTSTGIKVSGHYLADDNYILKMGTGADFQLFHDGSNSFINNTTGSTYITSPSGGSLFVRSDGFYVNNAGNSEAMAAFNNNGNVGLYYDSSKKFETTSAGISVTGSVIASSNVQIGDSDEFVAGAGNDLRLWHDGTNSYIKNYTGDLYIQGDGDDLYLRAADDITLYTQTSDQAINCIGDGAVELYYDNSKKFETYSSGVIIDGHCALNDNGHVALGDGSDLRIYHDGSNSYIKNITAGLFIQGGTQNNSIYIRPRDGENSIQANSNSGVNLYFDNSIKLETTSGGVTITDSVNLTGGHIYLADGYKLNAGTGDDLQIYHDGSNSYVRDAGTGNLILRNGSDDAIICNTDGSVDLFYDNVKTFNTTGSGIVVQGPEGGDGMVYIYADEGDDNADKWRNIAVNDGTFHIQNLASGSWETNIECNGNGNVELYYDASKKLETTSSGITINQAARFVGPAGAKECNWSNSTGVLNFQDEAKATFGTSNDLSIYATGSASYIAHNGDGDLKITTGAAGEHIYLDAYSHVIIRTNQTENAVYSEANGSVSLYYDGALRFATSNNGSNLRGSVHWCEGHFKPWANNTYDLGDSTYRWRNIYTNDLNLSNEGGDGNSVDGTTGNWTIQEGADDLFIVNNKNGKKFKIALQEVS